MGLKNYTPPRKKGEETTGMLSTASCQVDKNPLWGGGILRVGAADWAADWGCRLLIGLPLHSGPVGRQFFIFLFFIFLNILPYGRNSTLNFIPCLGVLKKKTTQVAVNQRRDLFHSRTLACLLVENSADLSDARGALGVPARWVGGVGTSARRRVVRERGG